MPSTAPPIAAASTVTEKGIALGLSLSTDPEAVLAELTATPQTLGSGPRCTIRLDAPGLRPMHCVVTPTAEGPVVRRWAAETLLNGEDFSESILVSGDCLQVGPIELTVIDLAPNEEPETEPAELPFAEQPVDEPAADLDAEPEVAEPTVEDATNTGAWLDCGIETISERLEEITAEDALPTPLADPAVPSRLLQPWSETPTDAEATPQETTSEFAAEAPVDEQAVEPEASEEETRVESSSAGSVDEWAVPASDEPTLPPAAEKPADEVVDSSVDAWTAEFASEPNIVAEQDPEALLTEDATDQFQSVWSTDAPEAEPVVAEEPIATPASETPAAEPVAVVPVADEEAIREHDAAFAEATAQVERLRARLRGNRERVSGLVAALRERREEIAALEVAVGERDTLINELQGNLQDALEVGEAARAELAAWQEVAKAQEVAAEETTTAAEPEAPAMVSPAVDELAEAEAEAEAEQIAADIAATMPTDPGVESVEAFYELPAENPPVAELHEEAAADDEATPDEAAPEEAVAEEESPWGIEQIAAGVQEPTAEAAPLWGDPSAVADLIEDAPTEETAVEPNTEAEALPLEQTVEPLAEPETAYEPEVAPESPIEQVDASEELVGETSLSEVSDEAEEPEPRIEITELIAKAAAKTAFDPLAKADDETPHEAPASFIEQYAHTLPDDNEPTEAPAAIEPVAEAMVESALESPGDEGDDDSIDDYMRKLMERVRGDSTPAVPQPTPQPAADVATEASAEPQLEQVIPEPEATAPIRCLSEMKREPQRQVTADMGALRQLANQSARHALDVAETRDNREQATMKVVASAVALGCGGLAAVTASDLFGMQFVGGLAGMAAGGWFGFKTLKSCQLASRVEEVKAAVQQQD